MIHFILGGQSSGKTKHGLAVAEFYHHHLANNGKSGKLYYVPPLALDKMDDDMKKKSHHHQAERESRSKTWQTLELGDKTLTQLLLADHNRPHDVWLVDSLSLWLYDMMEQNQHNQQKIFSLVAHLPQVLQQSVMQHIVIVSDEIGLAPIAMDARTRFFCQQLGTLHQQITVIADISELVVAGRVISL